MRTPLPTREKPRPLAEPLAAPAAANTENPAIDTMDESAVGGQTAVEAGDVGGRVGGRGSGVEDGGEGTGVSVNIDAPDLACRNWRWI